MTPWTRGRVADVLRWAYANDWRPQYPKSRRDGQYVWTNKVPDPGARRQSTLRVCVDISGSVEVRQLRTGIGWVAIGWFQIGSAHGVIDTLAGMHVLPEQFSRAREHRTTKPKGTTT